MSIEDLKDLRNRLAKVSKGTHVSLLADSDIAAVKDFFPTPSYDLNRILTGSLFKGVGSKTFTLLVGPEASFKSSCMCLCAAEAQKQGYTPIIIDTEGAWTAEFVERWGMDAKNTIYIYTPWVDDIMLELGNIIDSGDRKLCIIVDSIGGMEARKLVDDAVKGDVKADQGQLTRKIKRLLKMILNITKNQDSVAFASAHLYANTSGYGDVNQVGGGYFVKLGPDTIVMLKKTKLLDKEKNVIGNSVTATTIKNRFYPAFSEATIEIDYVKGINPLAGMVELAVNAGLIEKGGAGWYTNLVSGEKIQGEANAEKCIDEALLNKIDEWISKSGYSSVNKEMAAIMEATLTKMEEQSVDLEDVIDKPRRVLKRG